jgi:bisanhydrobacterioruberin hydratase
MTNKIKTPSIFILFLIITYSLGGIGFLFPFLKPTLIQFTPFILLLTFILMLSFQEKWGKKQIIIIFLVYLLSFIVEYLGVKTGRLFGSYQYGNGLGIKLGETPLLIGINWVMLTYCSSTIAQKLTKYVIIQIFIASFMMIGYDLIMETVAPFMDMWLFKDQKVPFQNYLVWFLLAFVLNSFLILFKIQGHYKITKALFIIQLLFFGIISIITHYFL